MNKQRLVTAAKEFARLAVLAIPGILIGVISQDAAAGTIWGAGILGILKSYDRGVHEDPTTTSGGILPF